MKFASILNAVWLWLFSAAGLLVCGTQAHASDAKFEAQLVWATNEEMPATDEYKPIDEETRAKLDSLECLKWKHFYLVKKETFKVSKGESKKVVMSDKCTISVKLLDDKKVEFVLFGKKGEACSKRDQELKPGGMLIHGGKVEGDSSAWLITLKRLK